MVELKPSWQDTDERRCVAYEGTLEVPASAPYGSHRLAVEVVDSDGARAFGQIELFVVTSWVEILKSWARPNPVPRGEKVLLAAEVKIIAPKSPEEGPAMCPDNEVERVMVNITQLLDVDCIPGTDCIVWAEMTDPDGDGVYACRVAPVAASPGTYRLPMWAIDTLGHRAKSEIIVRVGEDSSCYFDDDEDQDVDGMDLFSFFQDFSTVQGDGDMLKKFAGEFGATDCLAVR